MVERIDIQGLAIAARLRSALEDHPDAPESERALTRWAAKRYGVSYESARKWLAGETVPKTTRLTVIATDTRHNANWILTGEGERKEGTRSDQDLARLLWHWQALTPAGRRRVLHFAKVEHASQFTGDPDGRAEHERRMLEFTRNHRISNGVHEDVPDYDADEDDDQE